MPAYTYNDFFILFIGIAMQFNHCVSRLIMNKMVLEKHCAGHSGELSLESGSRRYINATKAFYISRTYAMKLEWNCHISHEHLLESKFDVLNEN